MKKFRTPPPRKVWHGSLRHQQDLVDIIIRKYKFRKSDPDDPLFKLSDDITELLTITVKQAMSLYQVRTLTELLGWDKGIEITLDHALQITGEIMHRYNNLIKTREAMRKATT